MTRYFHPYHLYSNMVSVIRTNKLLFRYLYGFPAPNADWGQYWDWTTVILVNAIKRYIKPGMHFLDLGCGPYAVLARLVQQRNLCQNLVAADHCVQLVEFARANDPQSDIQYLHSDLFSAIELRFDLIAFNAPYLDTERGKARGLFPDSLAEKRFCGGKDGVETVQRFLDSLPQHLNPGGIALLGVNHYHIEPSVLQATIWKSQFKCANIMNNSITKSCVYVLQRRNSDTL